MGEKKIREGHFTLWSPSPVAIINKYIFRSKCHFFFDSNKTVLDANASFFINMLLEHYTGISYG